jgi:Thiamine monophosphate kinase
VVALALPPDMPLEHVDSLYQGLEECARTYDVTLAGGDIVQGPVVSIGVALVGRALEGPDGPLLLRRDGARPGHVVAVSGPLGESAAGLRRLLAGAPLDDPLVRAHLRPHPPLALGQEAARKGIPCAIDISDGLLQDLGHVARMSGVGIELWAHRIPHPSGGVVGLPPGGPDPWPAPAARTTSSALAGREEVILSLTPPPTVIGRVVEGEGVKVLDERGHDVTPQERGWNHLRQR